MPLTGSAVKDPNYILRFAIILFIGVVSFGSVMFWKSQLLFAADYQEIPTTHEQLAIKKQNEAKKSKLQRKLIQIQE